MIGLQILTGIGIIFVALACFSILMECIRNYTIPNNSTNNLNSSAHFSTKNLPNQLKLVLSILGILIIITAIMFSSNIYNSDIKSTKKQTMALETQIHKLASRIDLVETLSENNKTTLFNGFNNAQNKTVNGKKSRLDLLNRKIHATKDTLSNEIAHVRAYVDSTLLILQKYNKRIYGIKKLATNNKLQLVRTIALARGQADSKGISHAQDIYDSATSMKTYSKADSVFAKATESSPIAQKIRELKNILPDRHILFSDFRRVADLADSNQQRIRRLQLVSPIKSN